MSARENRPSLLGVINEHPIVTLFVVWAVCEMVISVVKTLTAV